MYDVEILPDGNYICVGSNAINITQDSVHDYGWIMKVSAAGDILWQSNYLADTHFGTDQFLYDVNILDNGDLLACGELDYTYDVGITPIVQGWILRTDSNGCLLDQCWLGVNDINPPEVVTVKEYPNPASKEIIFEKSDEGKPVTLDIYNLLGQKVFESKLFSTLKVPTDMWQQAVYTWRAKQEGTSIGQGKVEIIK